MRNKSPFSPVKEAWMWEHSEKTHSNWREQMQKALQEGHITTIITFQGTQYMVTLQPVEQASTPELVADSPPADPNRPFQHARCICGANLMWIVREQCWQHTKGVAIGHKPTPTEAAEAAATPVEAPQRAS